MSRVGLVTAAGQPGTALLYMLLVAPFLTQVDATIVNVAIPSIEAEFKTSSAVLQWVVDGYLVPFAVLLVTCARLGRIHGYRWVARWAWRHWGPFTWPGWDQARFRRLPGLAF